MKLLLTSAGVRNAVIRERLEAMLPRPVEECDALCIPTAVWGHPMTGPHNAWNFAAGREPFCPMVGLGWASVGLLELTALPSTGRDDWRDWVRAADVLLVGGGDALFLAHWVRESGLADLLPELTDTVWLGMSAGSMVMTPHVGTAFVGWQPPGGGDAALGLVDFSIFPHLDNPDLPQNTLPTARRWAATLPNRSFAIDEETAVAVVDGREQVVSGGTWHLLDAAGGPHG